MYTLTLCASLFLLGADSDASLTEPRLENAQTLAMGGASQSNSFSNIAMLNNAAATVFIPRYSIETAYLRDPQFGWKTWITSLVDTTNRAFAGGLTYAQSKTNDSSTTLHQIIGSSGFALGQTISAGFNVRRIQGKGELSPIEEGESFWSTDISVALRMVPQWITGWAWRSVGKRPKSPLPESTHILSTAWLGMGFTVALDVEVPADEDKSALYKLGGEYIAARSVPIRLGWNYRKTTGNEVGVGIGWIEKSGALDLGFSKHFYGEHAWLWSAGLRLFY